MNIGPIIAIPPLPEGAPASSAPSAQPEPGPPAIPAVSAVPAAEAARAADPEQRRSERPPDDEARDGEGHAPHLGHVPGDEHDPPEASGPVVEHDPTAPPGPRGPMGQPLSAEELAHVAELRTVDAEVRAHEAAHMAAGAGLASGASFQHQVGPDGRQYAVGGEVSIDMSPAADPQQTIRKMRQVRAAALAPSRPSSQDLAVAAAAARAESRAMLELAAIAREAAVPRGEDHGHDDPCGPCSNAIRAYTRNTGDALDRVEASVRPWVRTEL